MSSCCIFVDSDDIVMGRLKRRMGSWLSYLWWGGDPDLPDPVSGLSPRDLHLLRKTWGPIYKQRVENGTEILKRVFRASHEIKDHFKMLRDVPEEEFAHKFQFTAHVINLMTAFNTVFASLDQPLLAAAILEKIGETHNRRKIPKKHFEVLQNVLVALFTELKFDKDTLDAWGRALQFMYRNIFPQLTFELQR